MSFIAVPGLCCCVSQDSLLQLSRHSRLFLLVDSSHVQSGPSTIYFPVHLLVAHFLRDLYLYPVLTSSEARPPSQFTSWNGVKVVLPKRL